MVDPRLGYSKGLHVLVTKPQAQLSDTQILKILENQDPFHKPQDTGRHLENVDYAEFSDVTKRCSSN